MRNRALWAALVLVGLLVPTGCSAPPARLPDGVDAWLHQQRSDVAEDRAQVRIVNDTASDLEISELRVADARFRADLVRAKRATVPAGAAVDLAVQLPGPSCGGVASEGDGRLTLVLAGGREVSGSLRDALGFLDRLHAAQCRRAAVERVVELRWGAFTPSPPGEPARLDLTLTPTGVEGDVRVRALQTTNLLRFGREDAGRWALGTAGAAAEGTVSVPLWPQRCDPHVVQEDKRGTVFTLEVDVEGEAGTIELPADDRTRARILTWVAQWCRFGG